MKENQKLREYPDVDIKVIATSHTGGESLWPSPGYGPRPDKQDRLLEEKVTLQQLTAVLQNERVRALVSLSFERERGTLNLDEFNELKELLRELGVPSISFRSTINDVYKHLERRRDLPGNAIDQETSNERT